MAPRKQNASKKRATRKTTRQLSPNTPVEPDMSGPAVEQMVNVAVTAAETTDPTVVAENTAAITGIVAEEATTVTVADPTPDNLVTLIRTNVEELSHLDGADKTFDDLDLDSLSMVEIATIIGQTYGVPLGEGEVVDAGDFTALSALVRVRTNA